MITQRDLVIAISQSGKSDELLRIVPYLKRNGIKMISMSGQLSSPLVMHSDIFINTSVPKEACPLGLAPTASTTLTLALGDALAICLLQTANFTQSDFAATHPHGALGRKLLLLVNDVMSDVAIAPLIDKDKNIKDSLFVMSKGEMGFVIILDDRKKPVGVFTDGDLRRLIDCDEDIRCLQISEVMTKDFISINKGQLAVAAVELMERHKVSALPVIDESGLIAGAINMRQLLQAGVV
jgi:arabinose-5-phosphate isomerase